ncbi:hypothetical protein ACQPW1_10320 [Nocardia sp. CA-128927]|uniref:hypothetical protein n=1 Tax=Nocardia sp. CA-128927 TaxID=3239975 RepID=UPI003D9747E9
MIEYFYQLQVGSKWIDQGVPRESLAAAAFNAKASVGNSKRVLLRHNDAHTGEVTLTKLWEGKRPPNYLGQEVAQ